MDIVDLHLRMALAVIVQEGLQGPHRQLGRGCRDRPDTVQALAADLHGVALPRTGMGAGIEDLEGCPQVSAIEAYQPQYSMVHRDDEPLIRWAAEQGMGVMTYGSLGGGILTGAFREPRTFAPSDSRNRFYKHFQEPTFSKVMELLKVMDGFSAEHGVPLSQIALNWCAQKDFVSTCIVGAQHREKVAQNAAAFDWSLTPEEMAALDRAIAENLG